LNMSNYPSLCVKPSRKRNFIVCLHSEWVFPYNGRLYIIS
jgi:hypothetical protein